jgi:hypothetical protein
VATFAEPSERTKAALKIICPSCKTAAGEYCLDNTKGIQPTMPQLPIRYICQTRLDKANK